MFTHIYPTFAGSHGSHSGASTVVSGQTASDYSARSSGSHRSKGSGGDYSHSGTGAGTGTGTGSGYSGSPRGSGYSDEYSGSGYSGYTGAYSGYSGYTGYSGYSGSGYSGESEYTELASDGAEIRSIAYRLRGIYIPVEASFRQRLVSNTSNTIYILHLYAIHTLQFTPVLGSMHDMYIPWSRYLLKRIAEEADLDESQRRYLRKQSASCLCPALYRCHAIQACCCPTEK